MGKLIDADICLKNAWQNFYKQEDEHEKNIDNYDIILDRFYEQSGFECCRRAIINAQPVEAIPKVNIITMLEEIKDLANDECWDFDRELDITLSKEVVNLDVIENIIQQKINELKEIENHDNTKPNYKRIQKLKDIVNKILLK